MSDFLIPFARQELLRHMLQTGGKAICPLQWAKTAVSAHIDVELTEEVAIIQVKLGDLRGQLTLQRTAPTGYLQLRDFIQDIANGRLESSECSQPPAIRPPVDVHDHDQRGTGETLFQTRNLSA